MRTKRVTARLGIEEMETIAFASRVRGVSVATFVRSEALRVARAMLRIASGPELPAAPSTDAVERAPAPVAAR